jgi:hypothetical protein
MYLIPSLCATKRKREPKQRLTILRVAIVDVAVTERSPGAHVPANPNRHDLTASLAEQIVELRVSDVHVKISNVQRRRHELVRTGARDDTVGPRHWSLMLNLNLRHFTKRTKTTNPSSLLDPSFLSLFFSNFFSFPPLLLFKLNPREKTLDSNFKKPTPINSKP